MFTLEYQKMDMIFEVQILPFYHKDDMRQKKLCWKDKTTTKKEKLRCARTEKTLNNEFARH